MFVISKVYPIVFGFEIILRYLFSVYNVFALYGHPSRLIVDIFDIRNLMFALPQKRRYSYLKILNVIDLIYKIDNQS